MTSLERILHTLKGGSVDRLPIGELMINTTVIEQIQSGSSYYDFIEAQGYDLVGPNTTWDSLGFVDWVDKERNIFKDRWGITRKLDAELIPVPMKGAVESKQELAALHIPDPAEEPLLKRLPELLQRFKGKKATFIVGRDAWTGAYMLRGMEDFMVDLYLDPDFARDVIKVNLEYFKEVHRLAIEMGIDIIHLADDYAYKTGPLVSPEIWKEFILPGLSEVVEAAKSQGAYCFKHTDGNIWSILDEIVDTGIDALGPLEPEADMDLTKVREKFPDSITLYGNISVDLLSRGTIEEIRIAVQHLLDTVAPNGRFILSSGNSITSTVLPENFMEMIEMGRSYTYR